MAIKGDTGPAGPRGYPGRRGLPGIGAQGNDGDSGITIIDNLDGTYTISTTNPPQSITFTNGAPGLTPQKGSDYFDAASGDYVTYVYCQVLSTDPVPPIDNGSGSYTGSVEVMPTGTGVTWIDNPAFTSGNITYVSKNRYKHDPVTDTWSLRNNVWTVPVPYINIIDNPVSRFTSYAFIRSTSLPAAPTGGDYNSPVPTTIGWSDGIPSGLEPVYMTKRLFTSDGNLPQEGVWSDPTLLGQIGQGTKHQFGPTSGGPWDDIPSTTDEWMVVCTKGTDGNWACDTSNPIQIKGEAGPPTQAKHLAFAFKRSTTPLAEVPTGGTYDSPFPVDGVVAGWSQNIQAGTADLYVSTRIFTSDGLPPQDSEWGLSKLFSGEGAINYTLTADSQVFAFDTNDANPTPSQINFSVVKQNVGGLVVWSADDAGVATALDNNKSGVDDADTFLLATEFGSLTSVIVTATTSTYSDSTTIIRIKDGAQGPGGAATETREVKFEYAPDNAGSPGTWHSKPLLVTDVWMREGTYYDGVLQGSLSAGTKIVGDDGTDIWTEFEFSSDDVNWHSPQVANDVYLRSRTVTDGIPGAWAQSTYVRGDDGVDGKYPETRFLGRSLALGAPANLGDYDKTHLIPVTNLVAWSLDPNIVLTGDDVIWAISCTKLADGSLDTNWSDAAVQWGAYTPQKGADYTDGLAGVHISRMFISATDNGGAPNGVSLPTGGAYDATNGETGVTANNWLDDPLSPQGDGEYIWETQQEYTAAINGSTGLNEYTVSKSWTTPTKYAYIPALGTDYFNGTTGPEGNGIFTSHIFTTLPVGTTPPTPTGGTY